ncbi:hypothetical protein ALQ59_102547 [Pseudomonas syringae pv. apii]|nr:hypothetical protein ALO87_102262 [Pseudomonas syringae pv. apii]RMN43259.1 hypothetical protein ALQ59_102547 [Pseudomonas syringae pv. apii]RMN51114.1 hypothetical protein ALQ58_102202 [Pseudomonas syringae pv. apii]RMO01059.1 hypothetical protein ALQ49_101859 [Pseudomonas syringae pv. apii]
MFLSIISPLAVWARLDLTERYRSQKRGGSHFHVQSPIRPTRGDAMSKHPKVAKPGRSVDTWAILFIVILAVGAAMFWASSR